MKRPEGWNDSTDQTAGCASVWKSSGGLDGLCEVRTDRGGVSISMHEAPPEVVAYVLWKAGVIPDVLFRLVRRAAPPTEPTGTWDGCPECGVDRNCHREFCSRLNEAAPQTETPT